MNWLQLVQAIVGIGEEIVPIFIHNEKSQKLEAVVITSVNSIMNQVTAAKSSTTTTTTVTK